MPDREDLHRLADDGCPDTTGEAGVPDLSGWWRDTGGEG